jgi:hypothetical protein
MVCIQGAYNLGRKRKDKTRERGRLTLAGSLHQFPPQSHAQPPQQLHLPLGQSIAVSTGRQVPREGIETMEETRPFPGVEPGNGRIGIKLHVAVLQLRGQVWLEKWL